MQQNSETMQVVKDAYAAFLAGDLDGFFSCFDDEVVMIEADALPYGGTFRGKAAVRAALLKMMTMWTGIALDVKAMAATEDYVIVYGEFSAVGKHTGRAASFPLAEVWRVANGKIIFLNPVYGDTKMACAALGV